MKIIEYLIRLEIAIRFSFCVILFKTFDSQYLKIDYLMEKKQC